MLLKVHVMSTQVYNYDSVVLNLYFISTAAIVLMRVSLTRVLLVPSHQCRPLSKESTSCRYKHHTTYIWVFLDIVSLSFLKIHRTGLTPYGSTHILSSQILLWFLYSQKGVASREQNLNNSVLTTFQKHKNFFTILQLNLFVYIVFYNGFKINLTNTTTVYFVMVAHGSKILPYLNGIFPLQSPKGTTTVSAKNHTQPARLAHESLLHIPLSHISFIKANRKIFMPSRPYFKGLSWLGQTDTGNVNFN